MTTSTEIMTLMLSSCEDVEINKAKTKRDPCNVFLIVSFLEAYISILHNGRAGFKRAIILVKIAQESVHPSSLL